MITYNHALELGRKKMKELNCEYNWREQFFKLNIAAAPDKLNVVEYFQTSNFIYFFNPSEKNLIIQSNDILQSYILTIYGENAYNVYIAKSQYGIQVGSNEFTGSIKIRYLNLTGLYHSEYYLFIPYLEFIPVIRK